MRKYFLTVLFYCVTLLTFGCGNAENDPAPKPAPVSDPKEDMKEETEDDTTKNEADGIAFLSLGDSYTIGESVSVNERWPVQLKDRLEEETLAPVALEIIATTGWTTGNLIQAVSNRDFEEDFDLVSLLIGVNNQYQGRSISEFESEFTTLLKTAIDLAGGDPSHVFVLSIPDYSVTPFAENSDRDKISKELAEFNRVSKEITLQAGVKYFDITPISLQAKEDRSLLADDGLHPSGKMYTAWVELLFPDVKAVVAD